MPRQGQQKTFLKKYKKKHCFGTVGGISPIFPLDFYITFSPWEMGGIPSPIFDAGALVRLAASATRGSARPASAARKSRWGFAWNPHDLPGNSHRIPRNFSRESGSNSEVPLTNLTCSAQQLDLSTQNLGSHWGPKKSDCPTVEMVCFIIRLRRIWASTSDPWPRTFWSSWVKLHETFWMFVHAEIMTSRAFWTVTWLVAIYFLKTIVPLSSFSTNLYKSKSCFWTWVVRFGICMYSQPHRNISWPTRGMQLSHPGSAAKLQRHCEKLFQLESCNPIDQMVSTPLQNMS